MNNFLGIEIEDWMPMLPNQGPPLPKSMEIYWPWYKLPEVPPEAPIYACPYCPAEFATEAELYAHIASAHPAQPPQVVYGCPYCGARFDTMTALQEHIAIAHPPPKVYTCPHCGAQFATETELSYHIQLVHPTVPPIVYTCTLCGATFATQAELDYHMATAHPEIPPGVADIRVENLTIEPVEVYIGAQVTISVVARNYGNAIGSKTITCNVNGQVSRQSVELAPGQSKPVTFTATPNEARTYQVSVNGLTGTFRAIGLPAFTFSNVSAQKLIMEDAPAFETMNFFCTITNPNPTTITKLLKVMVRFGTGSPGQYWIFERTLAPNQSQRFEWYGNTYGQRDPDAYNGPLVAKRLRVCMWLEDEQGNKSAEGCVTGRE